MQAKVAYTKASQSAAAGSELAAGVRREGEPEPQLALLFATVGHDLSELQDAFRTGLPGAPVAGCSVYGNITSRGSDEDVYSASAFAIYGSRIEATAFLLPEVGHTREITEQIAGRIDPLLRAPGEALLFLFPDAFAVNCTRLFAGLSESLSRPVKIVGGLASNDYQRAATGQLADGDVVTGGISGALVVGDFRVQIGVSHGSKPLGPPRTITRVKGQRILEIDGRPALEVLKSASGSEALLDYGQLVNLLGLGVPFEGVGYDDDLMLRAVLGYDEGDGSLLLGAELEEGTQVRFVLRDAMQVRERTGVMARRLVSKMSAPERSSYLYFNCDGRGAMLYGEGAPDVDEVRAAIGVDRVLGGCFCFGELGPSGGSNQLHNFTGVLVGLEPTDE